MPAVLATLQLIADQLGNESGREPPRDRASEVFLRYLCSPPGAFSPARHLWGILWGRMQTNGLSQDRSPKAQQQESEGFVTPVPSPSLTAGRICNQRVVGSTPSASSTDFPAIPQACRSLLQPCRACSGMRWGQTDLSAPLRLGQIDLFPPGDHSSGKGTCAFDVQSRT